MNRYLEFFRKKSRRNLFLASLGIFMVSAIVTFALLWNDTKQVTILIGDQEQGLTTTAETVQDVLDEEGIKVGEKDLVWPEKESKITEGQKILIREAKPVKLKLGNNPEVKVWTTSTTVEALLQEIGYHNQEEDIITPDLNQPIVADQQIEVIDVSYGIVAESQELKFNTVRKADNTMVKGSEKVVSQGKSGEKVTTYKTTYYNGKMVNMDPLRVEVTDQPKEQVVYYGTIESVEVGGYTLYPKKILKNVRLTAYSAGVEHTGKKPGDPGYAMTRSGTRATEGRTISVDPDLIPLGWWVYIDGYGLYRAEDTGGAVKGKIIDIYYENLEHEFGVKRGRTVYVIGPNKPKKSN